MIRMVWYEIAGRRQRCAVIGVCAALVSCARPLSTEPTGPARDRNDPAPSGAASNEAEPWLVEDFESPGGRSGGLEYEFDHSPLGTVAKPDPFRLEPGGCPASPGFAAHIHGMLGVSRDEQTWARLTLFLGAGRKPVDVRRYESIRFYAKADGGRYSVSLVRTGRTREERFRYEFTAPPSWTEIALPISELHQFAWDVESAPRFDDVTKIEFAPVVNEKPFDISIDHVVLSGADVKLAPITYDTKDWFPWTGTDPAKRRGTALDVSRLLDAPAGKHGPVTRRGDRFVFRDGGDVRFFGVSIVAEANFPSHEDAERLAELLAQLGVNMTRHHHLDASWTSPNVFGNKPTTLELDEASMERFDYFVSALQKRGIYQFFDLLAHRKLTEADGVLAASELSDGLKIDGEFAPQLIALQERFVDQLMNHRNRYTGKTYAADPALALLGVINEDSLFWIQERGIFSVKPTYRLILDGLFSSYLKRLVPGGRAALEARWGGTASRPGLLAGEDPALGNVDATRWLINQPTRASAARVEDTLRFLYETELAFYRRIEARVRKSGSQALVSGSNHWVEQPLDLLANAQLDFINRIGYWAHPFGYGFAASIRSEPGAMVNNPNLGSVGAITRRRVRGVPHVASEWQTVAPNPYREEGLLQVGAYAAFQGFSPLQFAFTQQLRKRPDRPGALDNNFEIIDQPNMLGAWPAVSLLFHRADVRPATLDAYLRIDPERAFDDAADPVFPAGLAQVARTGIDFEGGLDLAQLTALRDRHQTGSVITSHTGELRHDASNGHFWVDTARSQGFSGFKPNAAISLGNVRIDLDTPFAVVVVTALDDAPIASAKRLLVTALGNAVNTGMVYGPSGNHLLHPGTAPVLVEPVRARITLQNLTGSLAHARAYALGSSGERQREVSLSPAGNGSAKFDIGAAHRTMHYEVVRD